MRRGVPGDMTVLLQFFFEAIFGTDSGRATQRAPKEATLLSES
jgi:hypothetical protein